MAFGKKALSIPALALAGGIAWVSTGETHTNASEAGSATHQEGVTENVRDSVDHALGGILEGLKPDEELGKYVNRILAAYQENPPRQTTY